MNINRNNYEEFFLLYADNELTAAEKEAVGVFVDQHPDLKEELDMLLQAVLPANELVFPDKEALYRTTDTSLVNMTNFESFFVRYCDDELTNEEKAATELFVYNHPEFQVDFELIQQARLQPDAAIVFPDKHSLYRQQQAERKPVIGLWFSMAAAAIVLLIAGLFWLRGDRQPSQPEKAGLAQKEAANPPQKATAVEPDSMKNAAASPEAPKQLPGQAASNGKEQPILVNNDSPSPQRSNKNLVTPVLPESAEKPASIQPLVSQPSLPQLAVNETGSQKPAVATSIPLHNAKEEVTPLAAAIGNKPAEPEYIYVKTDKSPSREDYIYVDGTTENKKTPLRGLFRKATRVLEQNNPLGAEKKRTGVFTASAEQ